MKKIFFLFYSCIFFNLISDSMYEQYRKNVYPPKGALLKAPWLKVWAKDFIQIQLNLFSVDTLKVLAFIVPIYVGTRKMDNRLQCCFYDENCHRNLCQAPKKFYEVVDKSVPALIGLLSSFTFWSNNPELRLTSFVYTEAVISYWIAKNIFKNSCKCDLNLRPKSEDFCKEKKWYGGFPSGHVGEAVLATFLFGMRHGPKWGVPLGIYTAIVFAASVNGNRHYLSQAVGGLGLGLIYGFASYALIESKISCPVDLHLTSGPNGYNGLRVGGTF